MTPTDLRAEAEKRAAQLTYLIGAEGDQHTETRREILADALVSFAEKHAQRHGERERLEGRIEQCGDDSVLVYKYCQDYVAASKELRAKQSDLRVELATLERDKEAG